MRKSTGGVRKEALIYGVPYPGMTELLYLGNYFRQSLGGEHHRYVKAGPDE